MRKSLQSLSTISTVVHRQGNRRRDAVGRLGPQKATVCRPSARTGTKVPFSNEARAPSRALTRT